MEFSLEQQFSIRKFGQQIEGINLEQAKELLVTLYTQNLAQQATTSKLLADHWGIEVARSAT
jgi:Phycobilisome degradation protein nblA